MTRRRARNLYLLWRSSPRAELDIATAWAHMRMRALFSGAFFYEAPPGSPPQRIHGLDASRYERRNQILEAIPWKTE